MLYLVTEELLRLWGSNIRSVRTARGWTQAELAMKLGVNTSTVCRWESGATAPRDTHKVDVATALGADVRSLFPLVRLVAS